MKRLWLVAVGLVVAATGVNADAATGPRASSRVAVPVTADTAFGRELIAARASGATAEKLAAVARRSGGVSALGTQALAAPGDGGAKVDTYNWDGVVQRPCARDEGPYPEVTYTCRDGWGTGPMIIQYGTWDGTTWAEAGDITGGESWVDVKGGIIYEACHWYYGTGFNYDICDAFAINPRTRQYRQGGNQYYTMAAAKWANNQAKATSCVYAMYHDDPFDIAHECT